MSYQNEWLLFEAEDEFDEILAQRTDRGIIVLSCSCKWRYKNC